jgi:hypothetical protein
MLLRVNGEWRPAGYVPYAVPVTVTVTEIVASTS